MQEVKFYMVQLDSSRKVESISEREHVLQQALFEHMKAGEAMLGKLEARS